MVRSAKPWLRRFIGREAELDRIKATYERVRSRREPACMLLTGESGVGKTRVVQEFYAWVVSTYDTGARPYWPRVLHDHGDNLSINPEFYEITADWQRLPPFLWWGLRFAPDLQRNSAGVRALDTFLPHLIPHFFPFELQSKRELIKRKASFSSIDIGIGLVLNFLTLGIAGYVKSAVDSGFKVAEIMRYVEEIKVLKRAGSHAQIDSSKRVTRHEAILHDLERFFGADNGNTLILSLDDLHWANSDPDALLFLQSLLERAVAESWPLFVLATCWPKEWHTDLSAARNGLRFSRVLQDAFGAVDQAGGRAMTILELHKHNDLSSILHKALPGLTADQRAGILEKADGNPQLLDEIICYLRESKHLFHERKLNNALRAMDGLDHGTFGFELFLRQRFRQLPDKHKELISTTTLFRSIRFSTSFLPVFYKKVGKRANVNGLLNDAFNRFAVMYKSASGLDEFRHRVFFESASDYYEAVWNDYGQDRVEAILRESLEELCHSEQFEALTRSEQRWLLGEIVTRRDRDLTDLQGTIRHIDYLHKLIVILIEERNDEAAARYADELYEAITAAAAQNTALHTINLSGVVDSLVRSELNLHQRELWDVAFGALQAGPAPQLHALGEIALEMRRADAAASALEQEAVLLGPVVRRGMEQPDEETFAALIECLFALVRAYRMSGNEVALGRVHQSIHDAIDVFGAHHATAARRKLRWLHQHAQFNLRLVTRALPATDADVDVDAQPELFSYAIYTNAPGAKVLFTPAGFLYCYRRGPYTYEMDRARLRVIFDDHINLVFDGIEPEWAQKIQLASAITVMTWSIPADEWPAGGRHEELSELGEPVRAVPAYNRVFGANPLSWGALIGVTQDPAPTD